MKANRLMKMKLKLKMIGAFNSRLVPSRYLSSSSHSKNASTTSFFRTFVKTSILTGSSAILGTIVLTYEKPEYGKWLSAQVPELGPYLHKSHVLYASLKQRALTSVSNDIGKPAVDDIKKESNHHSDSSPDHSQKQQALYSFGSLNEISPFFYRTFDRLRSMIHGNEDINKIETEDTHDEKYLQRYTAAIKEKFEAAEKSKTDKLLRIALGEQAELHAKQLEDQAIKLKHEIEEISRKKLETELSNLTAMYNETSKIKLKEQEDKLREELKQVLISEEKKLKSFYERQVKNLLDLEREGRLARLDELAYKLKVLENLTASFAERFVISERTHRLWSLYFSTQSLIEEGSADRFWRQFRALAKAASNDSFVNAIMSSFPDNSVIVNLDDLQEEFDALRPRIKRFSLAAEDAGMFSLAFSYVMSFFMFDKHGLVEGSDVETRLSRAEHYLFSEKDIHRATQEMNQLTGWSRFLAESWLEKARRLAEAQQAFTAIEAHLGLLSMGSV